MVSACSSRASFAEGILADSIQVARSLQFAIRVGYVWSHSNLRPAHQPLRCTYTGELNDLHGMELIDARSTWVLSLSRTGTIPITRISSAVSRHHWSTDQCIRTHKTY